MKFKSLTIVLILFCISLNAQKIPSFKGYVRDSIYTFFNQFDHKLEISMKDADPNMVDLRFPINLGSSWKQNDTTYLFRFSQNFEEVKIKLYYKSLPVDIITARVISFPSPNILIEGNSNSISKRALKQGSKFVLDWNNNNSSKGFELFSCRVTILQPAKDAYILNLRSVEFPSQFIQMMSQAPINTQVIFDDIRVWTQSKTIIDLENKPFTFKVVD